MKKLIVMLLVVLFVLPAMIVKSQEKKPPPNVVEKTITIKGSDDWINTGIKIKPKDKVFIKADGQVCFHGGASASCVDPNGWDVNTYEEDWPNDYDECFDPLKEVNHAALIGNVGSDDFFLGSKSDFYGKEGVLYLGINDCSFTEPEELMNTGQFEVYIKVVRPK